MSDDIHALSGAYAVDALDDLERTEFEGHLAQCVTCRDEVDSLREAASLLAETTAGQPSPQLRERVLATISSVRPLPPLSQPAEPTGPSDEHSAPVDGNVVELSSRRRRATTWLAAAAAVVAIGTGGIVWNQVANDGSGGGGTVAERVMHASDHETYTERLANGGTATVYRSKQLDKAVLATHKMPAAPSGSEYALWLRQDGKLVPAGVMSGGVDAEIVLNGEASSAEGAGITVEQAGTTPTLPSGDVVVSIPFGNT